MGPAEKATRDERGAAAVEFALVAMILLTLMIGIIQFSIWFWGYQSASHAAREAARLAAVEPCDIGVIQARGNDRVNESAPTPDNTAVVTVTGSPPAAIGDDITVQVAFTVLDMGLIPGFSGSVSRSATSRVENIPAGPC
ncbi:hypothetical protein DDE18_10335 [Nocardioides gansuensis]|uniref:TadE-like domain-containing protein n=1 Tax=Nocardioides gansuensis TaxID=2138300 RepID=A0A2T8FAM8_9ACTN|nr:TadE family protein [Nocardioides gansuensis]PVG82753.1 hypothetical protein DDE18_10335 [Nocardioides gansuensis]